jgi:hypothetical protein
MHTDPSSILSPGRLLGRGTVLLWLVLHWAGDSAFAAQAINPPPIEWQRSFGGTGGESPTMIRRTLDGGWIVGGATGSPASGNKTSSTFRSSDVWLVRLNANGEKLWDATFGGTEQDDFSSSQPNINLRALLPTSDGGFVFGDTSFSGADGNKTSLNHGISDYWVVRVDSNGNKVWDQTFGGSGAEYLQTVLKTSDGGLFLAGRSFSPVSGNKSSTNFGFGDYWVVRVDANGRKLWDQSFGEAGNDILTTALPTTDGGFLLAGSYGLVRLDASGQQLWHRPIESTNFGSLVTVQPSIDSGFIFGGSYRYLAASNRYDIDYSVMRVGADGWPIWSRTFGGDSEDTLKSVLTLPDGGTLLGGYSSSETGGTKSSPNYGGNDYWVVRVDGAGNKLWDRSFGGSNYDKLYYLVPTADGGVILVGNSGSIADGNKTSPSFGGNDVWLVRLDSNGEKLWEQTFGGTGYDGFAYLQSTPDGGSIFCAQSDSPGTNGNKLSTNWGGHDFWIIKLGADDVSRPPTLRTTVLSTEDIRTNGYRLFFTGSSNLLYRIEFSADLANWTPLQTNLASGTESEVRDSGASYMPRRFYRARWLY